ncbi:MAG: hypothetical protein WEB53_05090 [Akkermansiaceae bacterium]
MPSSPETAAACLAPLQIIMLKDSLAEGGEGLHVEQVEIVFRHKTAAAKLAAAWNATIAQTEVLQMAFGIENEEPTHWIKAKRPATLQSDQAPPESWPEWLAADRLQPLLTPETTPWRSVYWPQDRRFVWTFHHSLLDGRSISRILEGFIRCLHTGIAPDRLRLATWQPPTAQTTAIADAMLRREFRVIQMPPPGPFSTEQPSKAVCLLGHAFSVRLESCAATLQVTVPTLLTWSWGQAVVQASGTDAVAIEQVRCGPPQAGTAGFSMNTLPLVIHRASGHPLADQLQAFRARLLALRDIEALAPYDLPPDVIEATRSPWASVIMIERGTLAHTADPGNLTKSIQLHECQGESLMAAAYQLPDLRLEVEGRAAGKMLEHWAARLAEICNNPPG